MKKENAMNVKIKFMKKIKKEKVNVFVKIIVKNGQFIIMKLKHNQYIVKYINLKI